MRMLISNILCKLRQDKTIKFLFKKLCLRIEKVTGGLTSLLITTYKRELQVMEIERGGLKASL